MSTPVQRCPSMGNKVIFATKAEAEAVLPRFRADWNGHGKVVRCFPNDHYHLTKNRKVGKCKGMQRNGSRR